MTTEPLFLLAALGAFLTMLILVQVFLAIRHDQVVSANRALAPVEVLEARRDGLKREIADLETSLKERRAALNNLAETEAHVDALLRQLQELKAEWESREHQREEIRAIRSEAENAWRDRQQAATELAEAEDQLSRVTDRLNQAEELIGRIPKMEERYASLTAEITELEGEARRLREAQAEVERLQDRVDLLRREVAEAEGDLSAAENEHADVSKRLEREREELAKVVSERTAALAQLASAEEALRAAETRTANLERKEAQLEDVAAKLESSRAALSAAETELRRLEAERRGLDADLSNAQNTIAQAREAEQRIAALEELVRKKRAELDAGGSAVDDETTVEDRLKELNTPPPVLAQLRTWSTWTPGGRDRQPEADALHRVAERFRAVGLEYHPRIQRAFHTSMKVNDTTQMTVLAGISGTGKSQLPRQYAAGMGIGFLQVPVQPRWDSPQDLMGFYNYIEGRFRPTDMARALWQMDGLNNPGAIEDRLLMILLDEMNLARVEYYFSDFLSRLESRPSRETVRDAALRKDAEIELEIPMPRGIDAKRVFPGYNLLFAGTMNEDESTQSLSDKVVDRANVLRFGAPHRIARTVAQDRVPEPEALPLDQWQRWLRGVESVQTETRVSEALSRMSIHMKSFKRPFGHRLGRAILAYVANYPETEGADRLNDALADQVEMRLLPKLRGVELDSAEVESEFEDLRRFVENDLRDEALANAIGDAVETARQGSGQFVWTGVTR